MNLNIPFEDLALIGVSRDKYETLPAEVKSALEGGCLTPLMQIKFTLNDTEYIETKAKLQLVASPNGNVTLMAYPVRKELDNRLQFNEKHIESLKAGEIIKRGNNLYQLDPETKSIISYSPKGINDMIESFEAVNDIHLGEQQKDAIRSGKPVELEVGGEKVVVGLSFKNPSSFMLYEGDMKEYQKRIEREYDELHPEYISLVQTDQNRWEYAAVQRAGNVGNAIKQDEVVSSKMRR